MERNTAYLGLGSNVGDRMGHLRQAIARLAEADGITLVDISPVYQTEPVGYEAQEDFCNMVARITTVLSPIDLFSTIKSIEEGMGRFETVHKGPRTIDIDIILIGDQNICEYGLSVPHPLMLEREFVLRPLFDLAPDLWIEPLHIFVRDALARVEGIKRVIRMAETIKLTEATDD